MKIVSLTLLLIASMTQSSWALDEFLCQCNAKAPGFEETNKTTGGIDKICSYSCKCMAWDQQIDPKTKISMANHVVQNINIDIINEATSAYSREYWDTGSHVCHGQYTFKPNLSDANWKISVKFDNFTIDTKGNISYQEDHFRQIANGINNYEFRFSPLAPEIAKALKEQLKKY
ncbi:MAG: hypothetical protein Q7U04_05220 [Bacteriovorax sp.]|nr:hypothetical protein [Bacteriovorax sp.]